MSWDIVDVSAPETVWNAFHALDLKRVKEALKNQVVVDLRNVYRPAEMKALGFAYHGIGHKS